MIYLAIGWVIVTAFEAESTEKFPDWFQRPFLVFAVVFWPLFLAGLVVFSVSLAIDKQKKEDE
jgi:hypothetical protein